MKVSFLMPVLEASESLRDALRSVAIQLDAVRGHDVEVVIAAARPDPLLKQIVAPFASFVRLPDGTDDNLYVGFNRALAAASGDIIGFLNSDDMLPPDALPAICAAFDRRNAPPHITGVAIFETQTTAQPIRRMLAPDRPLSIAGALFGIPAINARYFQRHLLDDTGGFETEAGLAADRPLLLRLAASASIGEAVSRPLYVYRMHPGSLTIAGDDAARMRVWKAELTLADYLERTILPPVVEREKAVWIARMRNLVLLKSHLAAVRQARSLPPLSRLHDGASALTFTWSQMPATVMMWRRWRKRLSGY